jgi:hypothetical protein
MRSFKTGIIGLALAMFAAACGGNGSGSDGAGAAAPDGGSVGPTADGAFSLTTTSGDPQACMINGNTAQVGVVDAESRQLVVTDGVGGVHVSCAVSPVSGTTAFDVHGLIDDTAGSGNYLEIQIAGIPAGASEAIPAHGTVVFSAPWTAGAPYQGGCGFYFAAGTKGRVEVTADVGRAWLSFSCAGLTSGTSTCPLQQGYAIFENCLGM